MAFVCGVLALQGDWEAHAEIMRQLGSDIRFVRSPSDLEEVRALVLPGGESSSMLRLMESDGLSVTLREKILAGLPVLATCAGVILLAEKVNPTQPSLGLLAVDVERNAYGRQVYSSVANVDLVPELGSPGQMEGVFIRAPRITRLGQEVETLGSWNGDPVFIRQNRLLAATFHPELTADRRAHQLLRQIGENGHD